MEPIGRANAIENFHIIVRKIGFSFVFLFVGYCFHHGYLWNARWNWDQKLQICPVYIMIWVVVMKMFTSQMHVKEFQGVAIDQ